MARISTYNLDDGISVNDLLLGSSYEGSLNGNPIYATRNYRLSDLAQFFQDYDFSNNISLSEVEGRVTALENAGIDLTAFSVSTNSPGTAALSYNNLTGQFTYTPPDLSSYITSVSIGFSDLTSTPTTIAGYGITDAFDGSYTSLTNVPTNFPPSSHNHDTLYAPLSHNHDTLYAPISHNHDDRYYTETEVDSFLTGYLTTSTNLGDLSNVSSAAPSTGQVLKWNGTAWAPGTDLQASGGTGISLTDLSVSVATAGTANLSYNNTSGTFTYTPPDLTGYIGLTGLSVTNASSSGSGSLAYNNTTGVFTYTPPDFSGSYLPTSGGTINGDLTVTGIININSATGTSNFINDVSIDGDLSVDGAFTIGTVTGDLRGDVYSIVGATSSVKVLESGSGNTPDTYYIGDLRNSSTDQVFDTSLAMFRKNLKIGDVANDLGGGAENLSLTLGATSKLYFADGAGPEHQTDPYTYINATSVSEWDAAYSSWVRDIDFSEPVAGQINITLQQDGTNTRALGAKILEGAGLTFSTSNGQLTMAVDSTEVLFISQLANNVVTGLSIDEGGSVTNVGSGAIKFIAGNNISLGADGTQKTITLNTTSDVLTTSYSKIADWDEAHDSNITSLNFASGSTADKIDINLVTRDAGVADINLADILREGTGITMSADATGFLTLSVNTNTIATQSYVTSALNNVVTGIALDNGSGTVDTATNGEFTFIPGSGISILRDGTNTNDLTFAFDNSSLGFITQTTLNNFTGSSNIATVGTITTGTWNGGVIASAYLDSDTAHLSGTQTFTGVKTFSQNVTAPDFVLSSDRDLKENIIPLAKREIKVDFKEYNFKGSNRTRFGVIAQELEEHHPEFVHTRERGEKSVSYIDLLVAKVHELEGRIKELENGSRNR